MRRFAYAGAVDLSDEVMPADDDEDDEIWHVLMGPGDVKVVSLDRLSDLYRWDLIDDRTYVWKPGMQAWQQLSLLIGSTQEPPKQEEVPWRVLLAPDEIKHLSLEQLDDWYRLDLIDDRTLIWQPGMSGWQPLGVVAGIETQSPQPAASAGMPVVSSSRPVTSAVPSPRPVTSLAPSPRPVTSLAPSSPPVALTLPAPARRSGGAERWLLGAALAAGLVVTLYRNDLVTEVARSVHQEAAFEKLGQRLGGPGFGTVGGVEALLEQSRPQLPEVRVPELLVAQEIGQEPAGAAARSSAPAAPSAAPTSSASPAPANPSGPTAPMTAGRSGAASLGSAVSPTPKHARSKGSKSAGPGLSDMAPRIRKGSRGRGTEYDPLNPNL